MEQPAYMRYAHDVLEGRVVAGELVQLACARFLRFLDDPRYEFRQEAVDRVIRFASHIRHKTGKHAGKRFLLEDWQAFACASIYGFYIKDEDVRLTKNVYIEIARKNGKTTLCSLFSLYGLIADGEMNAEVDLAANSRDQARIAFEMCRHFARVLNPRGDRVKLFRNKISFDNTLSTLNVFSSDSSRLDGFNASTVLLDEFHSAKDNRLRTVLASSQGMRESPLFFIITTAGFDKDAPCYETRQICSEILHGIKEDDSQFSLIYSIDDTDDWRDEKVWVKANPNLGVTVRPSFLRGEVLKAVNNPSEEVGVKTKNFNVWCDAETVWISDRYLLEATQRLKLEDFAGCEAWAGVDLASTGDLTALAVMIPKDDKYYFFVRYYLPESALREHRHAVRYGEWRRRGFLTVTQGNVTDYDYVQNDLMDISQIVRLQRVAYDSYNATQFTIQAEEAGLPMEPFSQALGNFNRPTKEFERLVMGGKVVLDNNDITRYCFRNVILKRDHNGNAKPSKQFAEKRIDGTIAILQALGVWLTSERYHDFY